MMIFLRLLPILIVVLGSVHARAETISSQDFATGYYLKVKEKGAVYTVDLPSDVYRTVKRADLSDVRVFNGAGEVVPHGFRNVEPDRKEIREQEVIPFFPLYKPVQNVSQGSLSLKVTRNNAGTIVDIKPGSVGGIAGEKINGYLLDVSTLKHKVSELEFTWQKESESSVYHISLHQSDDLERWRTLVSNATLADLQYDGQRVERRTVNIRHNHQKYIKVSWKSNDVPLHLTEVTGYSQIIESRQKRQWVPLYNGEISTEDGKQIIDFTTRYRLPSNSAQIRFPELNSIAKLTLQSRHDEDAVYRTRCSQLFYNLSLEGAQLMSEPCTFRQTSDSMWRLVIEEDGAGLQSDSRRLTLQLGWTPSELLFVGRGTPPYLLAFGSGKLEHVKDQPASSMILQAIENESPKQMIKKASLGKRINLGGKAALQPPPVGPPWKKWLLWTVLILGVALLAFMARSLIREMKRAEEKKVTQEE